MTFKPEQKEKLAKAVKEILELTKAANINPKLVSQEPTHMHPKYGKVKSVHDYETNKGKSHTIEIMEGEGKGKWSQALESEMKPIKKSELLDLAKDALAKARNPKLDDAISAAVNKPQQKMTPEQTAATAEKMKAKAAPLKQNPSAPLRNPSLHILPKVAPMSLKDYHGELERHDWHHEAKRFALGDADRQHEKKLKAIAQQSPEHKQLHEAFKQHVFSGPAYNTPQAPKPLKPVV